MWSIGWRKQVWDQLRAPFDLVIIGGGITGAGIFREAARLGYRTLLVEAGDFASGTSSRSSKLVHGGFRYLKNAQLRMTVDAVRERERLLREGRGLITQLGFLLACYKVDTLPAWAFGIGLALYDLLALKWNHRYYDSLDIHEFAPNLNQEGLQGGYRFFDAQTDDARLVLRLLREGLAAGGLAINYVIVKAFLRSSNNRISGVQIEDTTGEDPRSSYEVQSQAVINATGVWADDIRSLVDAPPRLRRLRGSHLVLPRALLPLTRAISFHHPFDHRPVFAIPWEGVTIFGTTDVDDNHISNHEPRLYEPKISASECEYLIEALEYGFPSLQPVQPSIQAVFSGLRPVINTGKINPSKESREHVHWLENGLLTITGGKLTTFRLMSLEALRTIRHCINRRVTIRPNEKIFSPITIEQPEMLILPRSEQLRLRGRYGAETNELLNTIDQAELRHIGTTPYLWGELRWSARNEGVIHLGDLLHRRSRIALVAEHGGQNYLDDIRKIVQEELGWDDPRWEKEKSDYLKSWQKFNSAVI